MPAATLLSSLPVSHLSKSARAASLRSSACCFASAISPLSASNRGRSASAGTGRTGGVPLMLPGIAGSVQPVASAMLPVTRACQIRIYHFLIGLRRFITDEPFDIGGRRRKPGDVEAEAANKGAPICFGSGLKAILLQRGKNKTVY